MEHGSLAFVDSRDDWDRARDTLDNPSVYSRYDVVRESQFHWQGCGVEAAIFQAGEARVFHPYIKRQIDGLPGFFDLVSPFEFGGFWTSPISADALQNLMSEFWVCFARAAKSRGYVSSFQRLSPWMKTDGLPSELMPLNPRASHVVLDLAKGYEELRKSYRAKTRNNLRKSERAGLAEVPMQSLSECVDILHQHLRSLGAAPGFLFPEAFYRSFGDAMNVICVSGKNTKLGAVGFFVRDGNVLTWLQSGSVQDCRDLYPTNMVVDIAVRRGIELGCRYLHLGGGQPSILHFKSGYSDLRMEHFHLRAVFDEEKYRALSSPSGDDAEFFPAYRR